MIVPLALPVVPAAAPGALHAGEGVAGRNAGDPALAPVRAGDSRGDAGTPGSVAEAPSGLLPGANPEKLPAAPRQDLFFPPGEDAGAMVRNASPFCAPGGPGTAVRAGIGGPAFDRILGLDPAKRVLLAQTAGWPAR